MFNDKPKEGGDSGGGGGGGSGIKLPKPEIETPYGTFGVGRVQGKPGITFKKTFRGLKAGGSVSSASKRADGCAIKGKTRGKMV